MKKFVSIILALGIAAIATAQPQGAGRGKHEIDFEKIKAQKVAFITSHVGLTPEDAQAFWPIYNKAEAEQRDLMNAEKKAYKELSKALADGQSNIDALLDAYINAKQANVNRHFAYTKDYKKAIGAEKTAKFFTCDEKFRREQIGQLRGMSKGPGAPGQQQGKVFQRGPKGEKPEQVPEAPAAK